MTTPEIIKLSFFTAVWFFMFQAMIYLLFVSSKRTVLHVREAKLKKSGYERCQEIFHCHCAKKIQHGGKHLNEDNMIVWE